MGRDTTTVLLLLLVASANGCAWPEGHYPVGPWELDVPLGPGEVRAGVVQVRSELLPGPEAHGWIGDFKMYNDRVAFIIQGIDDPRGWGYYGGSVLDAVWIGPDGNPGDDVFQEMAPVIDLMGARPVSAEVFRDGRRGKAVVRIEGVHQGFPAIDAAEGGTLQPLEMDIVHEYILEPDADFLLVRTTLHNRGAAVDGVSVGDLVLNGDLGTNFVPGQGVFSGPLLLGNYELFAGTTGSVCHLYASPSGTINAPIALAGARPFVVSKDELPSTGSGKALTVDRWLIVGDGGVDSCQRILNHLQGLDRLALLEGSVTSTTGEPEAGAVVLAVDLEEAARVNMTFSDDLGRFDMQLPPGSYRIEAHADAREAVTSDHLEAEPGEPTQVVLQVPPAAWVTYGCSCTGPVGKDPRPCPCKVSLQAGHDAEPSAEVDTDTLTFCLTGEGTLRVRPGDWTVTLSRGFEYTVHRQNITVAAGGRATVSGTLTRQVDTAGFIAVDLHNHTARSIDSGFAYEDKIASNVCEGLELVVITDHDCQNDLAPFVRALGSRLGVELDTLVQFVAGNEVSPFYGHMTAFPLPAHETGWNYWEVPWWSYQDGRYAGNLEFPALWARVRDLGAAVINIAHPLDDKGYFRHLGFDPPDVMPRPDDLDPARYNDGYDTLELLNGKHVENMLTRNLLLWAHLNNHGVFKTAVGVSDSHARTSEAGYGRTMVASPSDDPADIDLDAIWDSLRQGRASVCGGIFVHIRLDDATPGDLVHADSPFEILLQVEAADWVPVESVHLIGNGDTVAELSLEPAGHVDPDHPAVRFHGAVTVNPDVDTWYAAVATGGESDTLGPVCRGCRPVGMTNAIRVDLNGNSRFDPPAR